MTIDVKQETLSETKSEGKNIVINLNDDRDAYVVSDPKDIIHVNELEQVRQLLEQSVEAAKDYENSELFKRKHDTIMLAGVRGSGKTTFMLSLLNFVNKDILGTPPITFGFKAKGSIEVLDIFDPTLIEDKVHVFVNIISLIKERVDEKAKKCNCFKEPDGDDGRDYKQWETSFKKLAEGLPAINGVGHDGFSGDEWLDSEFVMNKGVGRAHAANHLERNFHDFVRKSLKFIGKTAFMLCFDDIDTNFRKGWPVLEVLHKYLTTPQFITILSGDAHLYSILIRDQQWGNFSDRLLEMESKGAEDSKLYKETVAHLEEQYFLKLLKSERRVFLNSLYQKEQQNKELPISVVINDKKFPLKDCYQELVKLFGIYSGGQQYTCYRFLASTPLRTQKQLLYAYNQYLSDKQTDFGNKILEIFWSDLAEKKVNVSELRNAPQYIVPQIIGYLVKNKLLFEGYTLTPVFSDHFINGSQFALGTLLTDRIKKDPSQIFEFWLKVCLAREFGVLMENRVDIKTFGPSVEDFVEYCAADKLRTARYVARLSTAYMRAFLGHLAGSQKSNEAKISYSTHSWHGTIPLLGFASKKGKNLPDRIDYVLDKVNKNYFIKIMGYLPLSGATNHRGESLPVYSFYNMLGVLGEIVLAARSAEGKDAVREVRRTIIKNSQFREYPLPGWALALSSDDDQSTENIDEENITDDEIERFPREFATRLVDWANSIEDGFVTSSSILAKSFTRFFYATNNMDKELTHNTNLGDLVHRMVVVFLNSVLVVESMETLNLTNARLNLRNPIEKDDIFIANLKKINDYNGENNKRLKLSKWILSCPLWRVYMKDKFDFSLKFSDPENEFIRFLANRNSTAEIDNTQIVDEPTEWNSLIDLLGQVKIREVDSTANATKKKKTSRKKIESRFPNFTVSEEKYMVTLANALKSKGYLPEVIVKLEAKNLVPLLKEVLAGVFNDKSISLNTANAIIKRIKNGAITW